MGTVDEIAERSMSGTHSGYESYPTGGQPGEPILAELVPPPRRRLRAGCIAASVFVGVMLTWTIFMGLPGELSRWKIASAEEKRLDGDLEGAIRDLDQAVADQPDNYQLLSKRAQWQMERGDYEAALRDCHRMVELRPDERSYSQRSEVLQYLGRGQEAVEDWKRIMAMRAAQSTRAGRTMALNGLAYYRGLANVEIDEALADIDEALRRGGEDYQMLDTRGYLYYRKGDFNRALQDLNRAVGGAEEDYESWRARAGGDKGFGLPDRREQDLIARQQGRNLAVILYHRGLVYQDRGEPELAEKDFQRVRELGFEPNEQLF
jgi:tetratricopeptide (TPR) repeat protein